MERGLRSLQHKHPVLFCTPHRENEKYWLEEDPTLRIPIFERERLNDETFREVYLAEIEGKPMEPGVCPNKVFVFQRELIEEKEIGLFLAHFFCDGFSFFNAFCHLLEVAFESPEREVKVTQTYALDCDSVFDREWQANGFGYLSFITNLGKALYRYIDNPFRSIGPYTLYRLPKTGIELSHENRAIPYTKQFTEEETVELRKLCRTNGVTMTGYIAACIEKSIYERFFQGIRGTHGDGCFFRGLILMSLRDVCQVDNEAMSAFASAVPSNYSFPIERSDVVVTDWSHIIFSRARQIREGVIGQSKSFKLSHGYLGKIGNKSAPLVAIKLSYLLSSLNIETMKEKYGDFEVVDGQLLQNARHTVAPLITAYPLGKRLHITCCGLVPLMEEKQIVDLLDDIMKNMRSFIS